MEALSPLIRRADAVDPLAKALEAILHLGLIVMTRDGVGGGLCSLARCWGAAANG
jgi:hypothetical protein